MSSWLVYTAQLLRKLTNLGVAAKVFCGLIGLQKQLDLIPNNLGDAIIESLRSNASLFPREKKSHPLQQISFLPECQPALPPARRRNLILPYPGPTSV